MGANEPPSSRGQARMWIWATQPCFTVAPEEGQGVPPETGRSTHGWMAFVFAFLAVAILLRIPGVYLWVERAFGPKSLADAVVRTALMAAAFGAQSLIREVSTQNPMPEPLGGGGFRRGEGSRGRSLGDCLR